MRRIAFLASVCLLTLTVVTPALAQQRLFVRAGSEFIELDPRLPSLGHVMRRLQLSEPPPIEADVVTVAGGRYFAWAVGDIRLIDTSNGAAQKYSFPGFSAYDVIGSDGNATFLALGRGPGPDNVVLVANVLTGSAHFIDVGPASVATAAAYAPESDVLFVARRAVPGTSSAFASVDAIDAASGAIVKTIDLTSVYGDDPAPPGVTIATNSTGTRLFVGTSSDTVAIDTLSGHVVAGSSMRLERSTLDEQRNRFVTDLAGYLQSFDAESLVLQGTVSAQVLPPDPWPSQWGRFSSQNSAASSVSSTIFTAAFALTPCEARLAALHADTGEIVRNVDISSALVCAPNRIQLLRITEPMAPRGLAVETRDHTVNLAWLPPFGAARYVVEAGSAPGLADIATIEAVQPNLTVHDVPPGTYYVRVRAANTIGTSASSQDVQVLVP